MFDFTPNDHLAQLDDRFTLIGKHGSSASQTGDKPVSNAVDLSGYCALMFAITRAGDGGSGECRILAATAIFPRISWTDADSVARGQGFSHVGYDNNTFKYNSVSAIKISDSGYSFNYNTGTLGWCGVNVYGIK